MATTAQPVALITGAARRIGAGIALRLHGAGMRIAIHYRDSHNEALALCDAMNRTRTNSACLLQAELSRVEEIQHLAEATLSRFGQLDALVNNASEFYPTPIEQLTDSIFDDLIASNLKGPALLIAAVLPALRRQHGCIVNISDIHARQPLAQHPVYCATKAGLEGLTRALSIDLAPQVRVNAIAPGAILWPEGTTQGSPGERAAVIAASALQSMGNQDDIAAAALFLIRDAPYVTGQILNVDGGRR